MKTKKALNVSALWVTISCLLPNFSIAQAGSLDLSFDTDGIVITAIGPANDVANSLAIQGDGKIVVAGYSGVGPLQIFTVLRYNTDGSLDLSFDTDGIVTTDIGTSDEGASSVAIQSDGKIVAAGYISDGINYDIAVVRYNTNGSLDNTFDADGIVTTDIGTKNDFAISLVMQSDGKIVVTGESYNLTNDEIAVVRYNTNGSLDNTFDTDGIVTTDLGISDEVGISLALQSDGKIVVAGEGHNGTDYEIALLRYNTNGSLDTTFDTDGIVIGISTSDDRANSVAIQSDGKIVVAGTNRNGSNYDIAVLRCNTNGSLDLSFDTDGIVTTPIGIFDDIANSVTIQSDGKIVVAGVTVNGTDYDIPVLRYNTNGSLDLSFDTDGIVTTPIGTSDDGATFVTLQSDGKIVVAGFSINGTDYDFALVRYTNNVSTAIEDIGNFQFTVSVFPNPFSSETIFETTDNLNNATLTVYNLCGQQVKQIKNISGQTITLHRDNLSSGLYFIHLTQDSKVIYSEKLVITD